MKVAKTWTFCIPGNVKVGNGRNIIHLLGSCNKSTVV